MPPRTRSPKEVQKEKDRIFNAALNILSKEGLDGLSMRRVATACKISSTKIYSYFNNKEHIYFNIMENAFNQLREAMEKAYLKGSNPKERLTHVICAIFNYALDNPYQYELIFSRNLPKCSERASDNEYVKTEHASGHQFYEFWEKVVFEYYASIKKAHSRLTSAMHLSTIHGCIVFQFSHNLQEIDVDVQELREFTVQKILECN